MARTQRGSRAGLPERFLRAGLGDAVWNDSAADRADATEEFSACGIRAIPAASRGSSLADPGSLSARDRHAAGRAVSAQTVSKLTLDVDRLVQQFHGAPLEDQWVYLILRRGEPAGAAPGRSETGADAGGLWSAGRRQPAVVEFSAEPGGEPDGLGRVLAGSVSARAWQRRSRLLISGGASAVLVSQDAKHSGESAEAGSRPMVCYQRPERGPDRLLDLQPVQPGLAESHPPGYYSLTSPAEITWQIQVDRNPPEAAFICRKRSESRG